MADSRRPRRPARPATPGRERRSDATSNEACPAARRRRVASEEAARAEQAAREAAAERRRRVERLRDEILRGTYHADPEKVAEAILEKAAKLVLQ
ncbi:flagellar biosynthesis anti-sigma factor FlgM [bacterium]|nr:flagellar biosynthesis anti-sigma factor FlgM [bacterium]